MGKKLELIRLYEKKLGLIRLRRKSRINKTLWKKLELISPGINNN